MESYILGLNGKKYPIAKPINNDGLKRSIIELVLNLAAPDDDCMLSDFLHALQHVIYKHMHYVTEAHQEELNNYNSYAAEEMSKRYELELIKLRELIESDRDLVSSMMGETAKPIVISLNRAIGFIQNIKIE